MAGKRSKTRSQQNMEEDDDLKFVTLSNVRELLKRQESTIAPVLRAHMETTNKRIHYIIVKINDFPEFTQAEVHGLKKQLKSTTQGPSAN